MPPSANIIIRQADSNNTPGSRDDLVLNTTITLLNQNDTGVVSWLWTLVDKPASSSATLTAPTSNTTDFTPDIIGTYLIKLSLNSGVATDQKGAAIKTAKLHYRIPAAKETTEFDSNRGWAAATNFAFGVLDDGYATGGGGGGGSQNLQETYDNSNPTSIAINSTLGAVKVEDASTPIGGNIFEVDSYGGIIKYMGVSATATTLVGALLQTGGKVGFGTVTPGNSYTIAPDLNIHSLKTGHNFLLLETTTTGDDSGIAFKTLTDNDVAIFLDESDSQKFKIALGNVGTDGYRISNAKLTLQQNGALGIGTTTPSALLDVNGTGHFSGQLALDNGFASNAQSSMGGFKITSVATPTLSTDAANKAYVDAQSGGGGTGGGSVADAVNILLTNTGIFTIASYATDTTDNYVIYVYYTVANAPTNLIITASWTDINGAQTFNIIPSSSQSVGSYSTSPLYFDAYNGSTITIRATAGTANNISVSTSIATLANNVPTAPIIDEKSNVIDFQLSTTNPTNIATYMPLTNGNFVIYLYYRVVTATTTMSFSLSWKDNSGNQTLTILSNASQTVNSYIIAPIYIQAITTGNIVLSGTAGTANNVFVSATITSV